MSGPNPSGSDPAALPALKRVKAAEMEWEGRLRVAREGAEATELRIKDEADATVKSVMAENEAARARALERARVEAEREAKDLLAEGERAAARAAAGEGKRTADHRDEILETLLGSFAD